MKALHIKIWFSWVFSAGVSAAWAMGCGDADGKESSEQDGTDTGDGDAGGDGNGDAGTDGDSDSDGDTGVENPWGFDIRIPTSRTLSCEGDDRTEVAEFPDADWLCTFSFEQSEGVLYVASSAVDCTLIMAAQPIYEAVAAGVFVDGEVSPLEDVEYQSGGNHPNDSLEFTFYDQRFRYDHSSFGFGWRACHPMDCVQLLTASGDMTEDGCTCDRTLPVVCVPVGEDGTWPSFEDHFAICPGDETCIE
jgi:hypothetical protein